MIKFFIKKNQTTIIMYGKAILYSHEFLVCILGSCTMYPYYITCGGQKSQVTTRVGPAVGWTTHQSPSKQRSEGPKVRTEHVCVGYQYKKNGAMKVRFWGTNGQKLFKEPDNQPTSQLCLLLVFFCSNL